MKLAIMQPYFFPYLGYFQLIYAADKFVFYDDVNFIKNGWINRNRFQLGGKARYFTVPLSAASPFSEIKDTHFDNRDLRWKRKVLGSFRVAYKNAPYASVGLEMIERALSSETESIGTLARQSVMSIVQYLDLKCEMVRSSHIYANDHLKGQTRVLDICRRECANIYINSIGGRELYAEDVFRGAGIELLFLSGKLPAYYQGPWPFVPGLSILDVIMHCSRQMILDMLMQYELLKPQASNDAS